MDRVEVLNELREIISSKLKIVANAELITEATNLRDDYNIDSMKIISLLSELEEAFNISIDSEDITIDTLTDISELITFILRGK